MVLRGQRHARAAIVPVVATLVMLTADAALVTRMQVRKGLAAATLLMAVVARARRGDTNLWRAAVTRVDFEARPGSVRSHTVA